jgi:hypothetical protein
MYQFPQCKSSYQTEFGGYTVWFPRNFDLGSASFAPVRGEPARLSSKRRNSGDKKYVFALSEFLPKPRNLGSVFYVSGSEQAFRFGEISGFSRKVLNPVLMICD